MVRFLTNYAETRAILLPGCIQGYKIYDMQLLPSIDTKRAVWESYTIAIEGTRQRIIGFSAFCKYYMMHIIITKMMSDLCWVCSTAIVRSANTPEEEKERTEVTENTSYYHQLQVYQQAKARIEWAGTEHAFYKEACNESEIRCNTPIKMEFHHVPSMSRNCALCI